MKNNENDFTGETMKIAVCDNEQVIVKKVASLLEDYIHLRNYDVTYETFSSYEGLKDKIKEFDLFLLDHNMNDDTINPDDSDLMTGMQFAQVIRETGGEHTGIIFMTSYHDLIYKAQNVDFTRFICKPVEKESFYSALDAYFNSKKKSGRISVRVGNDTHFIDIDRIIFLEALHKNITIYTDSDELTCHKSISDFEEELSDYGFFRTHRTYLVNIRKIKQLNSKGVLMENGETVTISKKNYNDLLNRYIEINQR